MDEEELLNEVRSLRAELNDLKDLVHKGIIEPIEKDYNDRKRKEAQDIWNERYGERLKPYEAKMKALDGDDFDLMTSSYDSWNETDMNSDEWVDMLIKQLEESLDPVAKAFGVAKEDLDATIEIEDGEVKDIVADTEPEEEEGAAEEEVAEESSEEPSEEETPAEEELSEEEQFQKELDDAYERMKEKRY
jgi:hypothetical protein